MAQLVRVLPRARITRAVGRLCDMPLPVPVSRAAVRLYSSAYGVNLEEAVVPDGAFPSFDAFFTRSLRAGARPSPEALDHAIVPADGRLQAVGCVDPQGAITVKGKPYRVAELLCDPVAAERYRGGQYAVIYLSPRDYHRVHAPIAGEVVRVRSREGELYPVNSIGERYVPHLLARNRRVAMVIESEHHGEVTVVMVAAMIVGRISMTGVDAPDVPYGDLTLDPPLSIARGEELGIFHLGSTAVLFGERKEPSWNIPVGPVRLGQPLSRSAGSAPEHAPALEDDRGGGDEHA